MSLEDLVDADIYDAVAKATSRDFAHSYLSLAVQQGLTIWPFTVTAYDRLKGNFAAMRALDQKRVRLVKPQPWSEDRMWPPYRAAAA